MGCAPSSQARADAQNGGSSDMSGFGDMSGNKNGQANSGGGAPGGDSSGGAAAFSVGDTALKRFTLKEIQQMTNKFKDELGQGSFGKVYKGVVTDWTGELPAGTKRKVAVKKLGEDSFQGYSEWLAEVLLLGQLQHPNLVRLLGYCADNEEAILVYEFVGNGTLDSWLWESQGRKPSLPWSTRTAVALNTAHAIAFLHEQNVIHRDLKSCNILLMEDFTAKVTDFGMATSGPDEGKSHVSTRVMGTLGYLDPKYMETGHLTPKSDVYSLGVIFLELLTGRPPMSEVEGDNLTQWVRPHLEVRRPNLDIILDPRLEGKFSKLGAHKMAIVAKHCVNEDPMARPQIQDIIKSLKTIVDLPIEDTGGGGTRVGGSTFNPGAHAIKKESAAFAAPSTLQAAPEAR